ARGDEAIDVMGVLAHQIAGLGFPGIDHGVEKNILAGQLADDGDLELLAEIGGGAEEHGVGKSDDVGFDFIAEKVGEAAELFALRALDAFEDGNGEWAEFGGWSVGAQLAGE